MDGDRPIREMRSEIEAHVEQGAFVFLKWTCPQCGERCIDDVPNRFCTQGYRHEEKADGSPCGGFCTGYLFGYLLVEEVLAEEGFGDVPHLLVTQDFGGNASAIWAIALLSAQIQIPHRTAVKARPIWIYPAVSAAPVVPAMMLATEGLVAASSPITPSTSPPRIERTPTKAPAARSPLPADVVAIDGLH